MKNLFMIFSLIVIFNSAKSQVSSDALVLQQIKYLQSQAVVLQDVMAAKMTALEAKEAYRTATGIVETLETIKKIEQLVAMLVCQLGELNINMSYASKNNCLFELKYNMTLLNIQQSTDFIKIGIVGKNLVFTQAERLSFIQTITVTLQKSIEDLEKLNKRLSENILAKVVEKYSARTIYSTARSFQYSRY